MDQFEFTKIALAVLLALLLIFGFKTIVDSRVAGVPSKPGYVLPVADAQAPAAAEQAAEAPKADAASEAPKTEAAAGEAPKADTAKAEAPKAEAAPAGGTAGGADAVLAALSKASADNGKSLFAKCKACHTIEKGKPKGIGPNLWGVVDRPKASAEGFEYSAAMKGKGGNWTFADLAAFISNPKAFVPGTKMVFNGLPSATDAADVIAYLAAQSDAPAALPK